jgi:hypothetical protein
MGGRIQGTLVAGWLLFSGVPLPAAEMTGKQIMEKQKELHKVKTEFGAEVMLLVDKDNHQERRQVRRHAKEMEKDVNRYLLTFLSPGDVKGTALLTWGRRTGERPMALPLPRRRCNASPRGARRTTSWAPISPMKIWSPRTSTTSITRS